MPATSLLIQLDQLPAEGSTLRGELDPALLDLEADSTIQLRQPIVYDLHAQQLDQMLHVEADLRCTLDAECGRCLEHFPLTLTLEDHHLALDIPPGSHEIDLAPALREDLLLELPGYPRCEDGDPLPDGSPRQCPAADRFPQQEAPPVDETGNLQPGASPVTEAPDPAERWKALDDLGELNQSPDPSGPRPD